MHSRISDLNSYDLKIKKKINLQNFLNAGVNLEKEKKRKGILGVTFRHGWICSIDLRML